MKKPKISVRRRRISIAAMVCGVLLIIAVLIFAALPGWLIAVGFLLIIGGAFGLEPATFLIDLLLNLIST